MKKVGRDDSLPYGFEEIDEGKLIILEEMVASGLQSMTVETYYKVAGELYKTLREAREANSREGFHTIYKTMVLAIQNPGKPGPSFAVPLEYIEVLNPKGAEEDRRKSILSKLTREEIEFLKIGQD